MERGFPPEICFTTQSEGKRFVGNSIEDYQEEDLVMFGANLPHGYITEMESSQIVIQMQESFLGDEFLEKPETQVIKDLFIRSQRGLKFRGETHRKAKEKIKTLFQTEGLPQIIQLLALLDLLANSTEYQFITREGFRFHSNLSELKRIQVVYDYILENYQGEGNLETAAQLMHMTKSSFCKFLKKHAQKTFSQIVNEIRISHACNLIIQTDKKISTIAFESGFNDISYFNRTFKKLIQASPKEFMNKK